MRQITTALCATVLSIACAYAASAADIAAPKPMYTKAPPAPTYNWTGFYIGGDAGGVWTSNTATWNPLPSPALFGANAISGGNGGSNPIVGLHLGYNWQFAPTWVAGVEGDWSWANAGSSFTQPWTSVGGVGINPGSFTTMSSKLNWVSSLRARVGYLAMPNLLAYATGGIAWGRIDYAATASNLLGNASTTAFSQTQTGFVAGGGLEWAITNNWSLRGEYLYYRLGGSPNVVAPVTGNPAVSSNFVWNATNVSVARAGVSYKF
jgi:outer membrane immunogenic protein